MKGQVFRNRHLEKLLWKLGPHRRKKVLKFFRLWSLEDELAEILSEEITKEINKEMIESIQNGQK